MAKLIGNYKIPGQDSASEAGSEKKEETAVEEFERRALQRLGGSIAFAMKGKTAVWNGDSSKAQTGRSDENKSQQ
jgi:hypothetical protein